MYIRNAIKLLCILFPFPCLPSPWPCYLISFLPTFISLLLSSFFYPFFLSYFPFLFLYLFSFFLWQFISLPLPSSCSSLFLLPIFIACMFSRPSTCKSERRPWCVCCASFSHEAKYNRLRIGHSRGPGQVTDPQEIEILRRLRYPIVFRASPSPPSLAAPYKLGIEARTSPKERAVGGWGAWQKGVLRGSVLGRRWREDAPAVQTQHWFKVSCFDGWTMCLCRAW